jgi:hypothetical protein
MPLRHRALALIILATVFGVASHWPTKVMAGDGFQAVLPDELKMTSEPLAPGAVAIILDRQVDRDDNNQTAHEYDYFRIKILKEEGRKYADVEIPFYKGIGNVINIKARTIKPDGSIVDFDGQIFEKSIIKAKGFRYMAKTFTLPEAQVGSIIEYYYTTDLPEYFIYNSRWILSEDLFTKHARFSLKPFHNNYMMMNLRWSWQGLPPGTSEPRKDPDGTVRLEANNIPPFETEDFMPPANELKSRVDFVYSREISQSDPDKFWALRGKFLNDGLDSFLGKHSMTQQVGEIVSPTDPPEVKLRKIYDRVQQIRNTSYEVRKTEQEEKRDKEKMAATAEDVWKRGYGNGVQITWLYLALVRAAGFEAYGVWVSDRKNYFFVPKLENVYQLDGNVVLIKLNGKDMYCDPGAEFTPFGLIPWDETAVQGLRLSKDGVGWVRTTLPESSDSQIQRKASLKLSDSGDLGGKLTVTFTGIEARQRRVEKRNADDADRKTFLEDEVKEWVPSAIEVELTRQPDWKSSSAPLVAEFDLKVPGWGAGAGRRALVPVGLFSASEKHVFEHANRIHPIYVRYPYSTVDDVTIDLPSGWQVASLPAAHNPSANTHIVGYSLQLENDKNALHLTRKLDIDFLLLDAKYYTALRNFFQTVRTADEEQIVLQPITTSAGQ